MMTRLKLVGTALVLTINLFSFTASTFAKETVSKEPIYISIDIDGTVFDSINDMRQAETTHDLVRASDGLHKPVHGAAAFVQSLLDIPPSKVGGAEIRLVFFSGGDAERNKRLLSQLVMKDGKSALDHTYKVLSAEDMTPVNAGPGTENLRRFERFKKDLKKIDRGINLARVVHVDDIPQYVLPDQAKNVLAIDPAYDYVENYSRYLENKRKGMVLKKPPISRKHWAYDTQRLIYARGVIEEALDLIHRREDISLRDAVAQLQQNSNPRRFLDSGKKALSRYNLEHTRYAREVTCPGLVNKLAESLVH